MRNDDNVDFGSGGGVVEVDETFWSKDPKWMKYHGDKQVSLHQKMKVLALIDRDTGQAKSMVIDTLRKKEIVPILRANIGKKAHVNTDEASHYRGIIKDFYKHSFVSHQQKEYARGAITTNTVEGYFSIFKRGMKGVYQHCSKEHLHRYAAEFEFRYNNRVANGCDDVVRANRALLGVKGKRLMYQGSY